MTASRDGARPIDPRITRIGWWLRWTHVDELPQLINVLKGEMSLVGPQASNAPKSSNSSSGHYPSTASGGLAVRPGVTGLAQLQLPPDTALSTVRRKLKYDLCYVAEMKSLARPPLDRRHHSQVCGCLHYVWIGRLMRLPNPNRPLDRESLTSEPELLAASLVTDSYTR